MAAVCWSIALCLLWAVSTQKFSSSVRPIVVYLLLPPTAHSANFRLFRHVCCSCLLFRQQSRVVISCTCIDTSPSCVFVMFSLQSSSARQRDLSSVGCFTFCPFVLCFFPSQSCPSVKFFSFFILCCREFLLPSASFMDIEPFLSCLWFNWTELLREVY